jgi:hypothetical protein
MTSTGCRVSRATSLRSGSRGIRSATSTSTARQWFAKQTTRGDIAEVRTEDRKLHMFVAIDRMTEFTLTELETRAKCGLGSMVIEASLVRG